MKRIIMLLSILVMIIGIIIGFNTSSYARVITNDPQVESEGEVRITISTTTAVPCFKIQLKDAGGLTFVSASKNSSFENGSSNGSTINGATTGQPSTTLATYIFKAPKVVETKNYTVTFSVTSMETEADATNTSTVTVKAKEQPPVQPENPTTPEQPTNPNNPTTPEQPTTPTVTEPKFTSVTRTMYATGDINLRSSWSTSSNATKVTKGTELTVTGTSSDKVNGYVWYRVNYNGTTKYVASSLLTNTKPEEKSNNANLKSLTVTEEEFLPVFDKETTSYTMKVAEEITKLEIKAEAEDEKATVTIKGNEELKEGDNTVTITVTAEDGTTKNYEIKVTKLVGEITKLGLQTLTIKDTSIARMFKSDIYEYEIDINDVTTLEIEAIANDETATVEILGNEDLKEGENIITIIVSASEGEEKATYQIKANKIPKEVGETKQIDSKVYFYVGIGALILIALIIVIVYTIRHRNQEEYEYTDNVDELPGELPERQEKKESKVDYFLDEEEERNKNRKGKHF